MKINLSEITEYSTQSLKQALEQNVSEYTESELRIIKNEFEQRADKNETKILNTTQNSSPRLGTAFILLFILYASQVGAYLNTSVPSEDANYLALIDIAFISFILMIIPFIARLYNKKPLSYEKGKSLCSLNSILLFIISLCMQIVIDFGFVGGLGALIYYFINMALFCEKKCVAVVHKKKSTHKSTFYANPQLSDAENQKKYFLEMPLEELEDLIENKKEEYTEEAYNIALEQYKLRSINILEINEKDKIKKDIELLDSSIDSLNKMLNDAKRDLGNLTVDDIENMFRQKLISKQQKNDMINSIEILQTIINTTPHSIETTLKSKAELEEKLNNLQNL